MKTKSEWFYHTMNGNLPKYVSRRERRHELFFKYLNATTVQKTQKKIYFGRCYFTKGGKALLKCSEYIVFKQV